MQHIGRFFRLLRNPFSRRSGNRFVVVGSWSALLALLTVSMLTTAAGARRSPALEAELTQGAQATAPLSDTASRLLADPDYAGFFEAANVNPNSREDEYAGSFSVERASAFLDRVAVGWGEAYRCVTCHTNGYYLTAPTALFGDRPAFREALQQAEAFVESWDAALPEVPEHDGDEVEDIYTYTVATAAFLTINDAQAGRELSRATLTALRRAWAIQDEDGHWPGWIKGNWPPFESDDHFGVTLMAIAVGMAPDTYRQREEVRVGMQQLRNYLTSAPPQQVHHKAMQLWAGRYHDDLVSDAERDSWIQELLELQRPDGGWASGDLGNWRQRDGDPTQPPVNVESDGYGTGFVIFALRQAGVSAANERLQRGIQWLKTNQRAAGHWWTQSLRNNPTTPNFLTHAGTTFALKALVSMDAL